MGADIHPYVETVTRYRHHPDGQEHCATRSWGKLSLTRNYDIFALLANVRGTGALFEPRGIPLKPGWMAETDYYDNEAAGLEPNADWHTPSWLTAEEFRAVLVAYRSLHQRDLPSCYRAAEAALTILDEPEDVTARLVFWFDN